MVQPAGRGNGAGRGNSAGRGNGGRGLPPEIRRQAEQAAQSLGGAQGSISYDQNGNVVQIQGQVPPSNGQ